MPTSAETIRALAIIDAVARANTVLDAVKSGDYRDVVRLVDETLAVYDCAVVVAPPPPPAVKF